MGNRRLGIKRLESVLKQLNKTTADSTGSRSGLTGFDLPAFEIQPAKYFGLFDDFLTVSGVTDLAANDDFFLAHAASGLVGAVWDVTLGGSGSPTAVLVNTIPGGCVKVLAGTADDDICRLFAANHMFTLDATSARKVWFETRLKVTDASQDGFFAGFASTGGEAVDTGFVAGGLDTAMGWQVIDGQASVKLSSIAAKDDTETVTASSTDLEDDTFVVLSIYFDGALAHYYINGTLSHSSATSLPLDGEAMFPHLEFVQQTGNNDTMHVDYVRCCMER